MTDAILVLAFDGLFSQKSLKVSAMMVKYKRVPFLKASSTRFQELIKCRRHQLFSEHINLLNNSC